MQIKNNCTSNSRVIARGKAECNFDCYEYIYSLIARKYMRLPTNHIAQPMTLQLRLTYKSCSASIVLYSRSTFINLRKQYSSLLKGFTASKVPDYTHFSLSASCCHIYPLPCISFNTSVAQFHSLNIMSSLLHLNGFHNRAF